MKAAVLEVAPGAIPLPNEDMAQLVENFIEEDIDIDGDGVYDAVSVGLIIEGIDGALVGLWE